MKLNLFKFKKIAVALILSTAFTSMAFAQYPTGTEYKATMKGWEVDLNKAYAESQRTGKPILANFTGSDWCGWCMRLKSSVFTKPEFKEWADKNVVLLELDYPRRFRLPETIAQQNQGLAQAFGVRGYPTVWVFDMSIDPETNQSAIQALAKTGYGADVNAWIKDLENKIAQSRAALKNKSSQ